MGTQGPKQARSVPRATPYLFQHRHSPTFRIRIPTDLQACLGKTEYRRSLGRCYASEAKSQALSLAAASLQIFSFARQSLSAREFCSSSPLGATQEETNHPHGYTSTPNKQEAFPMQQGISDDSPGYTTPPQGRHLAQLTDQEIRAIADEWLLRALKDSNDLLMQIAPRREQMTQAKARQAREAEINGVLFSLGAIGTEDVENRTPLIPPSLSVPAPDVEQELRSVMQAESSTAASIQNVYRTMLARNQVTRMSREIDQELTARGIHTDDNAAAIDAGQRPSLPYLKACQELMKARATFYGIMEQSRLGNFAAYDAKLFRLEAMQSPRMPSEGRKEDGLTPPLTQDKNASLLTLAEALPLFFEEKKREGQWNERTQFKEKDKFLLFQSIIDPDNTLPVAAIGAEHLRLYKKTLFGFPKNRNGKRQYKDMSLIDLISRAHKGLIPEEDRMAPRTIDNHFTQARNFINWACTNEYHTNPKITGLLTVAKTKLEHENRDPYSRDEIARIFNPKSFLTAGLTMHRGKRKKEKGGYALPDSGGKPSRFWIPLLGLFTGARIEELAQLDLMDVVAVDQEGNVRTLYHPFEETPHGTAVLENIKRRHETLCIFIRGGEGQSIKNRNSKRYVPLPPILTLDLDFLGYLSSVHRSQKERLGKNTQIFPELEKTSGKDAYSNAVSKWFQRYRKIIGITREEGGGRKDFHSFRDTISYWCDQIGEVDEKPAARYVGHKYKSMTFGVYSKDTAPHILYAKITAPFTEYVRRSLDIEGLKGSRWAGGH